MIVKTTKIDAAIRQLDVAIDLLFEDREPLAVRTLGAAAHTLLTDLVEIRKPGESWREKVVSDSSLPRKAVLRVLNEGANFLKHADRDAAGSLSFEETENDELLFLATLECGELGTQLSMRMQVFQIWFIASRPEIFSQEERFAAANKLFPEMGKIDRRIQLARGKALIRQIKERGEAENA